MKKGNCYVVFAGYGDQNWSSMLVPDFEGHADGLTTCELDYETGELTVVAQSHGIDSPSTLVVTKDNKFIYCTNEGHDFKGRGNGGGLTAFSFDEKTGETKYVNDNFAFGSSSAYIYMDKNEEFLLVANHGTKYYLTGVKKVDGEYQREVIRDQGVVCLFEINPDRSIGKCLDRFVCGGTGADPFEHASAHPHSVLIDDQDFIIIPNKGGDNVYLCKLNREEKKIEQLDEFYTGFGTSPRHAAFVPGTDYVVVIEEFGGFLNSFRIDRENGKLERISRIDSLDPDFKGEMMSLLKRYKTVSRPWAVDVQIHPDGKHIYVNNSQPCYTLFEIDRNTGELSLIKYFHEGGASRGCQIDRTGKYYIASGMMNECAYVFEIDPDSFYLKLRSTKELPTPTALRFIYPKEEEENE